jgi:hypothetical protein
MDLYTEESVEGLFASVLENKRGVLGVCIVDTAHARLELRTLVETSASCVIATRLLEVLSPEAVLVCETSASCATSFSRSAAQSALLCSKLVAKPRSAFDDTVGAAMVRQVVRPQDKVRSPSWLPRTRTRLLTRLLARRSYSTAKSTTLP